MGIDGLNTFIHKEFKVTRDYSSNNNFHNNNNNNSSNNINQNEPKPPRTTHLYFDLNNILHVCSRKCKSKNLFFKKLNAALRRHIVFFKSIDTVFYAVDGPGPHSKLLEQRKRRWDSALKSIRSNHEYKPTSDGKDGEEGDVDDVENMDEEDDEELEDFDDEEDLDYDYDDDEEDNDETMPDKFAVDTMSDDDDDEQIVYQNNDHGEYGSSTTTSTSMNNHKTKPSAISIPLKVLKEDDFESVMLTPGSSVMERLKQELIDFSKESIKRSFNPRTIIISSANTKGEGEWKIYHHINNHLDKSNPSQNVVVFSSDSDLLLYALLSPVRTFVVSHERSKYTYIDSYELRSEIAKCCPTKDPEQVVLDFVMLCLCNGSDYLPKLGGFAFQPAWRNYCKDKSNEILFNSKTNTYNWNFLKSIVGDYVKTYAPKIESPVSKFNTTVSMIRSCVRGLELPVFTITENTPLQTTIQMTFDGKEYTSTAPNQKKCKDNLVNPFLDIQHEFWRKYLKQIPEIHRNRIENAMCDQQDPLEQNFSNSEEKNEQAVMKYFEVVTWNIYYIKTQTQNYNCYYTLRRAPSVRDIKCVKNQSLQPVTDLSDHSPLPPLQFCVALSNTLTKHTVPAIFHSLYDSIPHFDYTNKQIWFKNDSVDTLLRHINNKIESEKDKLTPEQLRQLDFCSPVVLTRSPQNRSVADIKDVDLYDLSTVTLPSKHDHNAPRYHPYNSRQRDRQYHQGKNFNQQQQYNNNQNIVNIVQNNNNNNNKQFNNSRFNGQINKNYNNNYQQQRQQQNNQRSFQNNNNNNNPNQPKDFQQMLNQFEQQQEMVNNYLENQKKQQQQQQPIQRIQQQNNQQKGQNNNNNNNNQSRPPKDKKKNIKTVDQ